MLKKKIWANFRRIIEFFTQKIVTKISKIWVWDATSGKNLFRIPDPGVKKAPDPGSATLYKLDNNLLTVEPRTVDPHWFDADPDPDPAQNLDPDPDPDPGLVS